MIRCILADHEDRPFDHPETDDCCMHDETPTQSDLRMAHARVLLLETHLRRVLEIGDFMATGTTKELFDRWDQAASDAEGVLK